MELLKDPEEAYRKLCLRSSVDQLSNFYMDKSMFWHEVSCGQVYFETLDTGIVVWIDEGPRCNIRFTLGKNAVMPHFPKDKLMYSAVVFRTAFDKVDEYKRLFDRSGFRLLEDKTEFLTGKCPVDRVAEFDKKISDLEKTGMRFAYLQIDEIVEAYSILKEAFFPYNIVSFERMNWKHVVEKKQVVCIHSSAGEICGVSFAPIGFKGGLTSIAKKYQGKGLGRALQYYSFFVANNTFNQRHWVEKKNVRELQVLRSLGMIESNRRALVYVRDQEC